MHLGWSAWLRRSQIVSILIIAAMVSPIPVIGVGMALDTIPEAPQEFAVSSLTTAERAAFVDLYMNVFARGVVPIEDTPGEYPDYAPELQMELVHDLIQELKQDPVYSIQLDPVNAGPALGYSTAEDPLVDSDGNPVTQERVDGVYAAFLHGLIFDRDAFQDRIASMAEDTMNPVDAPEEGPEGDTPHSEADNELRKNFDREPMSHWGNLDPNATAPPLFETTEPVLVEQHGAPFGIAPEQPIDLPELTDPTIVAQDIDITPLQVPELQPKPVNLAAELPQSPMSAAPPEAWLDPLFTLDLPDLMDFLRGLPGVADDLLYEILGNLSTNVYFPDEIRGPLSEFPHIAEPVAELNLAVTQFDQTLEPLLGPIAIINEIPLPDQLDLLLAELEQELDQMEYSGEVNGVRFNGTWFTPVAVDVDGDDVADLIIQMNMEAQADPVTDINDLGADSARILPRLLIQRAGTGDGPLVEPIDPAVVPPLPIDPFGLDVMSNVPITREQLEAAGVAVQQDVMDTGATDPDTPLADPFPYHLTVAFYMPEGDELVVHDLDLAGFADTVDLLVRDVGPSVDMATVGGEGSFSLVTSVLHNEDPNGDVASLSLVGDALPTHMAASAAVNPAADTADLSIRPLTPMDLTATARRDNAAGNLALVASSEEMPAADIVTRGAQMDLTTVEGASLAYARQEFTNRGVDPLYHRGILVANAPTNLDMTLTETRISAQADLRGGDVRAIAGEVVAGAYQHAMWTSVEGIGRSFTMAAPPGGLTFDSEVETGHAQAVIARTAGSALIGEVAGIKINDELLAFGLPGIREASILPTDDGGFEIQAATGASTSFLLDVERNVPDGVVTQRFSFSNLPSALSVEVSDSSINIGSSEPVDQVIGDMSRPLDGPDALPTQAYVLLDDLDGTSSVAMNDANVNLQATGGLLSGDVLSSNTLDPTTGTHEFLALDGNHMLADVQGTVRQHSAAVTDVATLTPGLGDVGGIISGLAGGIGSVALNLGLSGPLCWSFGKDSNVLKLCISNVPDTINVDFQLVPHPSIGYHASEEIQNLSIQLIAPDVDILFFVNGIPEDVVLEFTRAGADLIMSDRIDAIGLIAKLRDTVIGAGIEDIPAIVHFNWNEGGMGPGLEPGDYIGRVYAFITRPGLSFFMEIVHLPQINVVWGEGVMEIDLSGDRIGSFTLQLIINPIDAPEAALEILFEANLIPGISATWDDLGGQFGTSDALGGIRLLLAQGPVLDRVITMIFEIIDVPQATATWGGTSFDLSLDGRIEKLGFQFLTPDIIVAFEALGVPGISVDWGGEGGAMLTEGPLDKIEVYFRKGLSGPFLQVLLRITDVPQISLSWGTDIGLDTFGDQIGEILFEFISDSNDDAADLYFMIRALGLPGLIFNTVENTFRTTAELDSITVLLRLGAVQAPSLLVRLDIEGVPEITGATWTDGFNLGFSPADAQIDRIEFLFLLDQAGTTADLFLNLRALGIPGIVLDQAGVIGTTNVLDELSLDFRFGSFARPTVLLQLIIEDVPKISAGGFGDEGFNLEFSPPGAQIAKIYFIFQLEFDLNNVGQQIQLLLDARGIPGIIVDLGSGGGGISTTATLDSMLVHFHAGKKGDPLVQFNLNIRGVPQILGASWAGETFQLPLASGKIQEISLEFILNLPTDADDIYLLFVAHGIPTVLVEQTDDGFSFDATGGIDSIALVFRKGVFAYDPFAYGSSFLGAWLRPDGFGTPWPGNPQFGISVRILGFEKVSFTADEVTNEQLLSMHFAQNNDLRTIVDLRLAPIIATADLTLTDLPRIMTLRITETGVVFDGSSPCGLNGCSAATPWLQGRIQLATPSAINRAPEPYWPWQTISEPSGLCNRNGSQVACGIMGNTFLDIFSGNLDLAVKLKLDLPLPLGFTFARTDDGGLPQYELSSGVKLGKLDLRINTNIPLPVWPYELDLLAFVTVSNLPTSLKVQQTLGSASAGGNPDVRVTTGEPIDRVFVGLRFDRNWYPDPGNVRVDGRNIQAAGFPIWLAVEDIPTSVNLATGKSSYGQADCQSCSPATPFFNYGASADTLDAMIYLNIGQLWNTIGRGAILAAGDAVPGWLRNLAQYDAQGHIFLEIRDIPRDGISIWADGINEVVIDPSPVLGKRLTKFFADFQLKFSDGREQPSTCIICLGFAELKYYWFYGWWFGIETLSILLEDLGRISIKPHLESIVDIDGHLVLHFRAGAGATAGAGLELYVLGTRWLCVCLHLPWFSLIIDPGFISFEVLSWSCCTIQYFYFGWPCVKSWDLHWCDKHWYVGFRGTYPGNWGFDLPMALPPIVPFRGLDIRDGVHHVFISPRILACAGGSWKNPEVFCWEIARLVPIPFVVVYAMLKYFRISADSWTVSHTH